MSDGTELILPAVDVAERSDPGRDPSKQVNEDACGHRETRFGVLAVVCDGMGGHVGGREASNTALRAIFEAFEKAPLLAAPRDVLRDAIRLANVRVRALAVPEEGGGRPGSTVVAVLVHAAGTEIAHVGDSRVFLVQQGQVFQITRDHSMVQEMVAAKILTPDQAAAHPDANKITRALGIDDDVEVEVRSQAIAHVAGDSFVLCSDGLSDLVEAAEILQVVAADPPEQAAGKLIDLANARGGHDNITVVIVRPRVSAPPAVVGAIAPTRVSTTLTLRPPAAPPFAASALAASAVAPTAVSPPPVVVRPSRQPGRPGAVVALGLVALALTLGGAAFWRSSARGGPKSVPFDAAAPAIQLGAAPSASVDLTPSELPEPSLIDAAGVAPLEVAPHVPMRHSGVKRSK